MSDTFFNIHFKLCTYKLVHFVFSSLTENERSKPSGTYCIYTEIK